MALDVYAVRPTDVSVKTVDQAREANCNWEGPRDPTDFSYIIAREDHLGGLPYPSDIDPTGFYAAPFAEWAANTFRFDMYSMQTPNDVDDFALKLRVWIAARNNEDVYLGNDVTVSMDTLKTLHQFAELTVRHGLWWQPEP